MKKTCYHGDGGGYMKMIKLIESVYKLVDELKLTAKLYFSKCTCSTYLLFLAGTKHPCCDHDFDSHVHTYIENLADNGLSQDEGESISHCPIFAMCVPAMVSATERFHYPVQQVSHANLYSVV